MLTKKLLLVLASGLLVSCSALTRLGLALPGGPAAIAKIAIPTETKNTITVSGIVQQQVPLLERTAYQLEDPSGKIWVISDKTAPEIGQQLKIIARVQYENIPVGNQDRLELYLIEMERTIVANEAVVTP